DPPSRLLVRDPPSRLLVRYAPSVQVRDGTVGERPGTTVERRYLRRLCSARTGSPGAQRGRGAPSATTAATTPGPAGAPSTALTSATTTSVRSFAARRRMSSASCCATSG